ncbi:cytidylyltransferase domain-containing protein [Clostridium sp. CF012]|uniref:cytidylyltransferase domain-containing protein n=1 Tax=Clostridium sp. CF012 TaxID=2843319 RepID=UPI001C0D59A9|nr:glycosyltransferase family protein [Clostridium sp. CF012]MBU3142326.1 glycosyltransferase family protein [Clostridium sp. CF012]
MRTLCIIQARTGSSRLSGKVLMKIGNRTIVEIIYERLKKCGNVIDDIIFAIPDSDKEKKLEDLLISKGYLYFKGSELNVLERYYKCAKKYKGDIIVRVTCDNPLVDYTVVKELVNVVIKQGADYIIKKELPIGITSEAMNFKSLEEAYLNADKDYHKEHVTSYFLDYPEKFNNVILYADGIFNKPNYRFTLDTEEDYKLMKVIYTNLYKGEELEVEDVIKFINNNNELIDINKNIRQKSYND